MRDRRNTNLSISSTSSNSSQQSTPSRSSLHEKQHASPPPSPTLPVPATEKSRKSRGQMPRSLVQKAVAVCVTIALVLYYFSDTLPLGTRSVSRIETPSLAAHDHVLVGGDELPEQPTALMVTDQHGRSRWTVWIPQNRTFPLHAHRYRAICTQADALSASIGRRPWTLDPITGWRKHEATYPVIDSSFLDIAEAEATDILPQFDSVEGSSTDPRPVCDRSLTFALDTEDASFGKSLILLWLSYGLAKREGRAFFIDDTRWPYGKYASFFNPPPEQGCRPPSPHYILPCPQTARHRLISAATATWAFGPDFDAAFATPSSWKHSPTDQQQSIYDMMHTGYRDLFRPINEDASYARERLASIRETAARNGDPVIIGMQIRRGDRHPAEYQYSKDYLPLDRYTDGARALHSVLHPSTSPSHTPWLLASDDPDIITSPEILAATTPHGVVPAQQHILLATKATLDLSSPVIPVRVEGSAYIKHVDENAGWEGGFYKGLFFSVGSPQHDLDLAAQRRRDKLAERKKAKAALQKFDSFASAASSGKADDESAEYLEDEFDFLDDDEEEIVIPEHAMRMRELVGRAYLLDLAVLGASDGVVCAVSSAACRVLGVMMGWEAVRDGRWVNVDDGRGWSWDGRRV